MNPLQALFVLFIRGYQVILSPMKTAIFGPLGQCRYKPTCSQYGLEAIRRHGAFKGSWLAFKRILRCNPWGGWGEDPVPKRRERNKSDHDNSQAEMSCCTSFIISAPKAS